MKTSAEIQTALDQPIPPEAIHKPDPGRGIFGEYVSAQWAGQEANNIFGWDGWSSHITGSDRIAHSSGDMQFVVDVEVIVRSSEGTMSTRSGRGVGSAFTFIDRKSGELREPTPQQVDTAAKAAHSDAVKNALARFGRHLGGELYFDERMAQVLGWEAAEGTARPRDGAPPPPPEDEEPLSQESELEQLGRVENRYGFGKEKKWAGLTLAEMYEDEDARGAMRWAFENQIESWLGSRMARYYELMQGQEPKEAAQVPQGVVDKADDGLDIMTGDKVQMWYGEMKPADGFVNWASLSKNKGFQELVASALNPDGKIADFHAGHKRALNHYKSHFNIDRPEELTWRMLQALYTRCKLGVEQAAKEFPQYYQAKDDPPIVVGPSRNQSLPSSLQVAVSKGLGVKDPDEWLWKAMGEKAVGEWTEAHTAAMLKLIDVVKERGMDPMDFAFLSSLWKVVNDQIRATTSG